MNILWRSLTTGGGPGASSGAKCLTRLPAEALPLLSALVVARSAGALTEDEAVNRAASFAVSVAVTGPGRGSLLQAQALGREVLVFIKLRESYPHERRGDVEAAAKQLVTEVKPDTIDALWVACSGSALRGWVEGAGLRFPARPAELLELCPGFFDEALSARYALVRREMADLLSSRLRGAAVDVQAVDRLREHLPKACFWRVQRMVAQGAELPGWMRDLTPDGLEPACFAAVAQKHLAGDFALSVEDAAACAGPGGDALLGAVRQGGGGEPGGDALLGAVRHAVAPLKPELAPEEGFGQVRVDVLTADALQSPEYRLGDLAKSIVRRTESLRPYVRLRCNGSSRCTRSLRTATGRAEFGETFLLDASPGAHDHAILELSVFDARRVTNMLRGDPVIGSGSAVLLNLQSQVPVVHTVDLVRDGRARGSLQVRVSWVAPRATYGILANTKSQPLSEVARALAVVLNQAEGIDALLKARPWKVDAAHPSEGALRKAVQVWVCQLLGRVSQLAYGDEHSVIQLMAATMRSAEQIVAMCALVGMCGGEGGGGGGGADACWGLTVAWIRNLLGFCAGHGPDARVPAVDEARLQMVMEAAARSESDPLGALHGVGATLPDVVPGPVLAAIARRLRAAEEDAEDELFTGERIVESGRIRGGMAAVVLEDGHAFLYDYDNICKWMRVSQIEPNTRQHLSTGDIIKLQPLPAAQ